MGELLTQSTPAHLLRFTAAADRIVDLQTDAGAILWFEDGPWDPWNHTECVMALYAMGYDEAGDAGFAYLHATQLADGAWLGEYGNALPMADRDHIERAPAPALRDTNFTAYPAVGAWYRYLLTEDKERAREDWQMVRRALMFVLSLQAPSGVISWAGEAAGTSEDDALLTGNASIAKSLSAATALGKALGEDTSWLEAGRASLIDALINRPDLFDRRNQGARFAMDWYYPILSHGLSARQAKNRLEANWSRFVLEDLGCRCVEDEPWVTVAETCELVLALLSLNARADAEKLFRTQAQITDAHQVYWMGYQYEQDIFWPKERPSWTQAAVILAADALYGSSPASRLLIEG